MSLLFRVLFAQKCKSTHHKLAMDALRFLDCEHAEQWRNLFVAHIEPYLEGSKAPDTRFKDFRNHVLHVSDDYWGGAVVKTEEWYARLVEQLRAGDWRQATYSAGVLSHYYTDPVMPLHTGQSERETAVHRAIEWSVTKSYFELQNILMEDLGGYPAISPGHDADWLAHMVVAGAQAGHAHYDTLVDHYDLESGTRDPTKGLDQESKDCIAALLGHATIGFARILDRAIQESAATPPATRNTLAGVLTSLSTPIFWITRKLADAADRAIVKRIYAEVQETGRAIESLPDDEREVRRLHADEVLQVSEDELAAQPAGAFGTRHGEGAAPRERSRRPVLTLPSDAPRLRPRKKQTDNRETDDVGESDFFDFDDGRGNDAPRFYLSPGDPVADAPSIGPKTAARLEEIEVDTVEDLLRLDPDSAAADLDSHYMDADTIRDWQTQSHLMCTIPGLRGHDAQILVGCGIESAADLAAMHAEDLCELAGDFAATTEGQGILRGGAAPDLAEVSDWIAWAALADEGRAAA